MSGDFLGELFDARALTSTGVAGVFASGEDFERVVAGLSGAVRALAPAETAERMVFPPMMNRREFERSGYARGFTDRVGAVHCFCGDADRHAELVRRHDRRLDWTEGLVGSDLVLTPSACYPVYPAMAARGAVAAEGVVVDVVSYCFRREWAENEPARLQSFRMHERVFIGPERGAVAFRRAWLRRAETLARVLQLDGRIDDANDPFFGDIGPIMIERQRAMALKHELLVPIRERAVACASVNSHLTKMSDAWGLELADGSRAHTACVGFGLERLTLALMDRHGISLGSWPDAVRDALSIASPEGAARGGATPMAPGSIATRNAPVSSAILLAGD